MNRDWRFLPTDLLRLVTGKLNMKELVQFTLVCKDWSRLSMVGPQSAFNPLSPPHDLPRLLIPDRKTDRIFMSLFPREYFELPMPQPLRGMLCCGAKYGWLVLADEITRSLLLFNPTTQQQIRLPDHPLFNSPPKFEEGTVKRFVSKAILVGDPTKTQEFTVAAIVFGDLFWVTSPHLSSSTWKLLSSAGRNLTDIAFAWDTLFRFFDDLGIMEGNTLYQLMDYNEPWCKIDSIPIPLTLTKTYPYYRFFGFSSTSNYDLYGVWRAVQVDGSPVPGKRSLRVFTFDLYSRAWMEKFELGGGSLFLSDYSCMHLSSFPSGWEIKPNCVYFTSSKHSYGESGTFDMGVYSMEDETYHLSLFEHRPQGFLPISPLWVYFNSSNAAYLHP